MFHDLQQSMMDALEACQTIQKFIEGYTLKTYLEDHKTRCAVERQFEILGEAFNKENIPSLMVKLELWLDGKRG
jgi:uncharacterized protein with HEPN domain